MNDNTSELEEYIEKQLNIAPCEDMEVMNDALAAQDVIQKEIGRLKVLVSQLRSKQADYYLVGTALCAEHEYRRIPYDPYSPLVCTHCHHHKC